MLSEIIEDVLWKAKLKNLIMN